ncbi:MAG: ABC transporter permease [Candidatus Omnitrophica bacterium]|nr:ABC transporter permease [Candidatus Omnitrophota bacterium]
MTRYLAELVQHQDLLFWLAAKEIKVRYKLPLLGFLWTVLVPLGLSGILWLVFTFFMPISMSRYPFFLFLITGMFPWNFFAQSLSSATMSVLDAGALIRKTAFPRVLIPLSIVAANLFNFMLALGVVVLTVTLSGRWLSPWLWLLPVAVGVQVMLTIGMALLVAGLQVRYRDVKYITELGLLLWFYMTPIFYPLESLAQVPVFWQQVYALNPCVGIIELYRLAILGATSGATAVGSPLLFGLSAGLSGVLLVIGVRTFRRQEPVFADWVTG